MKPGELLADRYELARELGGSGAGATWLARDTRTGNSVVAKILSIGLVKDWKSLELFEREAAVLKSLRHPGIPAAVDSFRADRPGDPRFVLVREYVEGTDLQAMVDNGWRGTEEDIRGICRQLLVIVSYIHSLRPPVIHRDITPRNIVMREGRSVSLVDFGGAWDAIRPSSGAEPTVIGTPGYAPMEQFMGRASARSDLYGLAATLVFLLTRRSPADLPTRNLKLDLAGVIEINSSGLRRLLSNWLEPDESARTLSLEEASVLLEGEPEAAAPPEPASLVPARPPLGSRLVSSVRADGAIYSLPLGGRTGRRRMISFGTIWMVFVGFWTYSAVRMRAPLSFLFFAVPFLGVGVGILWRGLGAFFGRLDLEIGAAGLSWSRRFLFSSRRRTVPLEEVGECRMERGLFLDAGARTLAFGGDLSHREQEWLRDSINERLVRVRRQDPGRGRSSPS